ncbi:MAG: aldose 1-epimerase [Chloroflexota bacterium]
MTDQTSTPDAAPALPPGWKDAADKLYRIVSGDGEAVAWVCPEIGGNTVAYAVNVGEEWIQLLDIAPPATLRETPSRYGLPVLFPFPGHMRNRRYQWAGREIEVPPTFAGTDAVTHGFAHVRPWRLVEQTPSRVVCELRTPGDLADDQAASYPFTIRLTQTIELDTQGTGELLVTLTAVNEGDALAPVAFGLHPYFGAGILGADRTRVHVELPGKSERVRTGEPTPFMTSERAPAPANPVSIVPLGQTMATGRTDFRFEGDTARIIDLAPINGQSGWTVDLEMIGYKDILFFAPPAQNSISLEPQSHMPSCASMPEGHPDGLVGLAPGATLEAVCRIRLVPPVTGA